MVLLRPLITETSLPYWTALNLGRIEIQRCDSCRKWVFYPRRFCSHCGGTALTWTKVSGDATVYTYTVAMTPVSEDFLDEVPLVLAVAELLEGVRIPTTLVQVATTEVSIGMKLKPVFDKERLGDITLLRFRPS